MTNSENRGTSAPTNLIHYPIRTISRFFPSLFENLEQQMSEFNQQQSGLTIYEDTKNVFVEANLPGLTTENIDVIVNNGELSIKGEKAEETEDKERKYYSRSTSSFSYRVSLPSQVDESKEPEATYTNGVLKLKFAKSEKSTTKKIQIKNK